MKRRKETRRSEYPLRELGIHLFTTPTPFPVGRVNNYLIEDSQLTLIDTGIGSDRAWEFLESGIDQAGYRVKDIKRVFITHGHIEHYGMARKIVEESGAEVFIHSADREKVLEGYPERSSQELGPAWDRLYRLLDVPASEVEQIEAFGKFAYTLCRQLETATPLDDGDRIAFDRFELEVVHTPGHSPGTVCFFEPINKILFCGDHVLKNIPPSPVLEIGEGGFEEKPKSLVNYLASLDKVESLQPSLALPGHGSLIEDTNRLFIKIRRYNRLRNKRLLSHLDKRQYSIYKLTKRAFPLVNNHDVFLTLSEVVGALEVMETEGIVEAFVEDGLLYYRLADHVNGREFLKT